MLIQQTTGQTGSEPLPTFDPIFFSMSRTRTFCWMYMSSGDFPGASSRFIPPSPVALWQHTNKRNTVKQMKKQLGLPKSFKTIRS